MLGAIKKWGRLVTFIKMMRKKHNRYDFKFVTTGTEIVIWMVGEKEELRIKY